MPEKNQPAEKTFTALLALSLFLFSCSVTPGEKFEKSLEDCIAAGTKPANSRIIFLSTAKNKFETAEDLRINNNIAYLLKSNKLEIFHPAPLKISIENTENISTLEQIDITENRLAFTHRGEILIYSISEKPFLENRYTPDAEPDALCIYDKNLLLYMEEQIFIYDIKNGDIAPLSGQKFRPPSAAYFKSAFIKGEETAGLITGAAGNYNLNVIRPAGEVLATNISMSSSRAVINGELVRYISGHTGEWKLTEYDYINKKKKFIGEYKIITDILLFNSFLVLETPETKIIEPTADSGEIPLPFNIISGSGKEIFILEEKTVYVFDENIFIEKFTRAGNLCAGFFQ